MAGGYKNSTSSSTTTKTTTTTTTTTNDSNTNFYIYIYIAPLKTKLTKCFAKRNQEAQKDDIRQYKSHKAAEESDR